MNFETLRTWAEINLDSLKNNFEQIRSMVPAKTQIMAVIKADGYGHGAVQTAKTLEQHTDFFAVAMLDEGLSLIHI